LGIPAILKGSEEPIEFLITREEFSKRKTTRRRGRWWQVLKPQGAAFPLLLNPPSPTLQALNLPTSASLKAIKPLKKLLFPRMKPIQLGSHRVPSAGNLDRTRIQAWQ